MNLFGKGKEVRKSLGVPPPRPFPPPNKLPPLPRGYLTMDDIQAKPDPIKLAADLSHELEEARHEIDELRKANEEYRIEHIRARATAEAYKELILELHYKGN